MELLGIFLGLGLLLWLAYRGWSVLLVGSAAALVSAAFRRSAAHALDADLHGRRSAIPGLVSASAS